MENICNKTITTSARDWGITGSKKCIKTIFKDGLCKHHYERKIHKQTPWGERDTYRPATIEDMQATRSLKLADTHVHMIFRLTKGIIHKYHSKTDKWIPTDYPIEPKLFVVKIL